MVITTDSFEPCQRVRLDFDQVNGKSICVYFDGQLVWRMDCPDHEEAARQMAAVTARFNKATGHWPRDVDWVGVEWAGGYANCRGPADLTVVACNTPAPADLAPVAEPPVDWLDTMIENASRSDREDTEIERLRDLLAEAWGLMTPAQKNALEKSHAATAQAAAAGEFDS